MLPARRARGEGVLACLAAASDELYRYLLECVLPISCLALSLSASLLRRRYRASARLKKAACGLRSSTLQVCTPYTSFTHLLRAYTALVLLDLTVLRLEILSCAHGSLVCAHPPAMLRGAAYPPLALTSYPSGQRRASGLPGGAGPQTAGMARTAAWL